VKFSWSTVTLIHLYMRCGRWSVKGDSKHCRLDGLTVCLPWQLLNPTIVAQKQYLRREYPSTGDRVKSRRAPRQESPLLQYRHDFNQPALGFWSGRFISPIVWETKDWTRFGELFLGERKVIDPRYVV
jgi:hypothetical protein